MMTRNALSQNALAGPVNIQFARLALTASMVTAIVVGLGACASVPVPEGEMATARAAVENARRAGAGQLAESEMREAQDLLTRAERAQASKDNVDARRAAEQARLTAEVAQEKARLAKATQARSELDATLKALRGESAAPQSR